MRAKLERVEVKTSKGSLQSGISIEVTRILVGENILMQHSKAFSRLSNHKILE